MRTIEVKIPKEYFQFVTKIPFSKAEFRVLGGLMIAVFSSQDELEEYIQLIADYFLQYGLDGNDALTPFGRELENYLDLFQRKRTYD